MVEAPQRPKKTLLDEVSRRRRREQPNMTPGQTCSHERVPVSSPQLYSLIPMAGVPFMSVVHEK